MKGRILKTVITGVGRMGRRHIQAVQDLGLELVGIHDIETGSLELAQNQYGIHKEQLFTNLQDMLERTRPECVIIATTAPAHCEYTCVAADAGVRYILCEKPMAVSLAQCDRMIAVCREHGAKLSINHPMRFMERYTEPKRVIQSEVLGGVSSVTVIAGNFGMAMNGTHCIEMFRYVTDEAPIEAAAWFSSGKVANPRGPQFEDRAGNLRLTTASGKRFYLEAGEDQGHGMLIIYSGPYGQLIVDGLGGKLILSVREEQHRSLPTTQYGLPGTETRYEIAPTDVVAASKAVLSALLEDDNYPSGADGRLAIAALVAAYVSNERQHISVSIDDNLPQDRVFPWA